MKNRILSLSYLVFNVFFLFTLSSLSAANLHTFIICDTHGHNIGDSVEVDLHNIRNQAHTIALQTGLSIKEILFHGEKVKPKEVEKAVKNLKVNREDVLLFYFSGHGYRTPSKMSNPWPNMYFSITEEGMDFAEVADKLERKKPRLLLMIADCCNNEMRESVAPPLYNAETLRTMMDRSKSNYKTLFLKTRGVILVTSSKAGEYSWCVPTGALFTNAFLKSLQEEVVTKGEPDWQVLLDRASFAVERKQTPHYLISLY